MKIKILGRNIFAIYHHYIMKLDYCNLNTNANCDAKLINVEEEKVVPMMEKGSTISPQYLAAIKRKNGNLCKAFVLKNIKNEEFIGTAWLMLKGADEEYRIKNVDAYIFNFLYTKIPRKGICKFNY